MFIKDRGSNDLYNSAHIVLITVLGNTGKTRGDGSPEAYHCRLRLTGAETDRDVVLSGYTLDKLKEVNR